MKESKIIENGFEYILYENNFGDKFWYRGTKKHRELGQR